MRVCEVGVDRIHEKLKAGALGVRVAIAIGDGIGELSQ